MGAMEPGNADMGTCAGRARGNHSEQTLVFKTPLETSLAWWLESSSDVPAWRWWHTASPITRGGAAMSSSPVPWPGWGAVCVPSPCRPDPWIELLCSWVGSQRGDLPPGLARGFGGVFSPLTELTRKALLSAARGNAARIIFPFFE